MSSRNCTCLHVTRDAAVSTEDSFVSLFFWVDFIVNRLRFLAVALLLWCCVFFAGKYLSNILATSFETLPAYASHRANQDLMSLQYILGTNEHFKPGSAIDYWNDLSESQLSGHGRKKDPWGQDYQIVDIELLKTKPSFSEGGNRGACLEAGLGIYSCGEDGLSETHGDDLDDVNSWTGTVPKYYSSQIHEHIENEKAMRFVVSLVGWTIWLGLTAIALLKIWPFWKSR